MAFLNLEILGFVLETAVDYLGKASTVATTIAIFYPPAAPVAGVLKLATGSCSLVLKIHKGEDMLSISKTVAELLLPRALTALKGKPILESIVKCGKIIKSCNSAKNICIVIYQGDRNIFNVLKLLNINHGIYKGIADFKKCESPNDKAQSISLKKEGETCPKDDEKK